MVDDVFICCRELLLADLTDPLNLQRISIVDLLDLFVLLVAVVDYNFELLLHARTIAWQQLLQDGLRRISLLLLRRRRLTARSVKVSLLPLDRYVLLPPVLVQKFGNSIGDELSLIAWVYAEGHVGLLWLIARIVGEDALTWFELFLLQLQVREGGRPDLILPLVLARDYQYLTTLLATCYCC